jgi:hypothetical protein
MFIRVAFSVTLYCDVEIPTVARLREGGELPQEAIDDINGKLAEFMSQEEGLGVGPSRAYPAISHVRVFPFDDHRPEGEWVEVDRQEQVRRERV